jgi:hypothetical protein
MAVLPTHAEAWRLLPQHLFDHPSAPRLGNPLRLDDDRIPRLRLHPFSPPDADSVRSSVAFRVRATVEPHSPGGSSLITSDWRAGPARASQDRPHDDRRGHIAA